MIKRSIARIVRKLGFRYKLKWLSDKTYLELVFYDQLGYKLNLCEPKTFNEKMQWLKLYNRQSKYIMMVDKCEAKKYVASIIGEEYIIPTIGVWDNIADVNFSQLPNQFVMKCTHDSGCVVVCKDKTSFNFNDACKRLHDREKKNFYYGGREWPYKDIKPRIIVEQFLKNEPWDDLRDYKFFSFNGKVKFFKVDFDRFIDHHANYYDVDGQILHFGEADYPPKYDANVQLPSTIGKMVELAEKLSKDIPFVRVDFYDINGRVYFGEITFSQRVGLDNLLMIIMIICWEI